MRGIRGLELIGSLALVLSGADSGGATVVDSTQAGFLVHSEAVVSAAPDSVYRALVGRVGAWWDAGHTFSGDSRNLSLDATPGGCFCESLPQGGGVRHLTVVFASPGRVLRLVGALGPLQGAGVAGSLTWNLTPVLEGTKVGLDYSAGGYLTGGLAALAPAVDAVMEGQLSRLKRFVETGRPDSK
jgi:hypothetical protein